MREDAPAWVLHLQAPAKLNLSLHVTGLRDDGLHELAGAMVLLELADDVALRSGAPRLRLSGRAVDGVPSAARKNLAWRGLVAGLGGGDGWSLSLRKRIPVQAGLGGGSSDAAAAWRLGRRAARCEERASSEELLALADIGADVPFFVAQVGAAWVTGTGERIQPLALPPDMAREVLLVHPPFGLSTARVFAELRPDDCSLESAAANDIAAALDAGNDLLGPARRLRPELDDLTRLVLSTGAQPRMTGSGPTLFVLVDDPERADAVSGRLGRAGLTTTRTRLRAEPASIGLEEVSA